MFTAFVVSAQSSSKAIVSISLGGEKTQLNKSYYIASLEDSLVITKLKFYLSTTKGEPDSYMLFDLAQKPSIELPIDQSKQQISLFFGVDSTLNMAGAQGGALDPMNDMYWTWNSGYINFKLEGYSKAIDTRKNKFQLHLGGFLAPNNAFRTIVLTPNNKEDVTIELDLSYFFSQINLKQTPTVMSPSTKAMVLSDLVAQSFRITNE